ncbi:MAG: hypothetical protein AB8F78_15020 [Saprospiraceae bacterium]
MTQHQYSARPSLGSAIVGLLVFSLFVYVLFRVAAFTVSTLVSGLPIFFGIGLIVAAAAYYVDKRVPTDFVNWLGKTFTSNPLKGLVIGAATVVFAPFVAFYLLAKALLLKKVKSAVGDFQQRAADQMRDQYGGGAAIGVDDSDFTEVKKDDGLVIRIPKEE